jgi:hypothetical protein
MEQPRYSLRRIERDSGDPMYRRQTLEDLIGKRILLYNSDASMHINSVTVGNVNYSIIEKVYDDMFSVSTYVNNSKVSTWLYSIDYVRGINLDVYK